MACTSAINVLYSKSSVTKTGRTQPDFVLTWKTAAAELYVGHHGRNLYSSFCDSGSLVAVASRQWPPHYQSARHRQTANRHD